MSHQISEALLTPAQVMELVHSQQRLQLSPAAQQAIHDCRQFLETAIAKDDTLYYGINTGFGSLCNVRISKEDIAHLQYNLIVSHACGVGDVVPPLVVKVMLLLKIQSLSYGYSGVRVALVQRLIDFYNADVLPVIYQLGSLGASGDLAPLAHLSLPLIGEGEVYYQGVRRPAREVLTELGWEPLTLQAKEGLALLNGTQFSTAYAVVNLQQAYHLLQVAAYTAAMGIEAFQCHHIPFMAALHRIRQQTGQQRVATHLRHILQHSPIDKLPKSHVQDPYAFRCIPQVHGATLDTLMFVTQTLTNEINAVTDNPTLFRAENLIVSGGNFHAQPIALAMDYLAIAMAEIGNIAERRIYQLISGQRGLPPFLTPDAGLHSGLMIAQYTAAGIVSQNKQWCTPASVDSIVSCNGQEDHVSMAANAATKCYKVIENVERLLGIELLTALQALYLRNYESLAAPLHRFVNQAKAHIPPIHEDRIISHDIHLAIDFVKKVNVEFEI